MKAIDNFFKKIVGLSLVKKHFKYICIFLFLVSIYLVGKLFFLTWYFGFGGGGGFIDLGLTPIIGFKFHWNIVLGLIGFVVLYYSYTYIKQSKKEHRKLQTVFLGLFISLILYPLFNFLSPQVSFELLKEPRDVYVDRKGNIDIDKYIYYMVNYCNPPLYTCSEQIITEFDTVEDYIRLFEAFNKTDNRIRYEGIFGSAKAKGFLPELIEKYNDKTFYAYVIFYENDKKLLNLIKDKTDDLDIGKLIIFYHKKLEEVGIKRSLGQRVVDLWKEIDLEAKQMIDSIEGVNHKIL